MNQVKHYLHFLKPFVLTEGQIVDAIGPFDSIAQAHHFFNTLVAEKPDVPSAECSTIYVINPA